MEKEIFINVKRTEDGKLVTDLFFKGGFVSEEGKERKFHQINLNGLEIKTDGDASDKIYEIIAISEDENGGKMHFVYRPEAYTTRE